LKKEVKKFRVVDGEYNSRKGAKNIKTPRKLCGLTNLAGSFGTDA
jgi:hypothetical protein